MPVPRLTRAAHLSPPPQVMQMHLAPGQTIELESVTSGQVLYTALEGETLSVSRTGNGRKWSSEERVTLTTVAGQQALVVDGDLRGCQSLLQVIDTVLLPADL